MQSDRLPFGAAGAVALGAATQCTPTTASTLVLAGVAGLATVCRRRLGVVLRAAVLLGMLGLLAGTLSARAHTGLTPAPAGAVHGVATLMSDPREVAGGIAVVVELHGRRYEAVSFSAAGGTLRRALAGERVTLHGRNDTRPVSRWMQQRHIVGRLNVERASAGPPGAPVARAAAAVHRLLGRSAALMGDQGALYRGLVVGDVRDQSPELREAFLAAGLTHLTAVSGQNVAFVLAVASPLLTRLPRRGRAAAALAVIAMFTVITRAEPSVLRASTMAAFAVLNRASGRRRNGLRALACSVVVLLLVDPLLVHALALWLSVLATGGILLFSAPIAERLRGPEPLRAAVGVTVAAQLATAPLLLAVFGSIPVVSLPANVLASPAAGPVMMWGLSGGMLAGVLGGQVGTMLQLPARAGVRWLEIVALSGAALPLGELRGPHLVALGVLAGGARLWRALGPVTARTRRQ